MKFGMDMDHTHGHEFCIKYYFKLTTKYMATIQTFDIMCDRFSREQYGIIFKL
jgi:hypothetical protein